MSTPRFPTNPFTDVVPRRGATSSKAGFDTYRRLAAVEQAVSSNTSVDMDSLNLYRALGAGVRAWTYDPGFLETTVATHTGTLTSGTIYAAAVYLPSPATITGVLTYTSTAGVGTWTRGRVAVYDANGSTRLAWNNNDLTLWKTLGLNQIPFTGTVDLDRGLYYVALINVRSATTTTPAIASRNGQTDLQNLLVDAKYPRTMALAGQADLQTSYDFSTFTLSSGARFMGLY